MTEQNNLILIEVRRLKWKGDDHARTRINITYIYYVGTVRIKQLGDDVTAKNIKPLITTIYYIVGIVKVKQIGDETKINAAEQVKISNYTKKMNC